MVFSTQLMTQVRPEETRNLRDTRSGFNNSDGVEKISCLNFLYIQVGFQELRLPKRFDFSLELSATRHLDAYNEFTLCIDRLTERSFVRHTYVFPSIKYLTSLASAPERHLASVPHELKRSNPSKRVYFQSPHTELPGIMHAP